MIIWGILLSTKLSAQESDSSDVSAYPKFEFRRDLENYQLLASKRAKNFWEKLKYISTGKSPSKFLSLGGNVRSEFQILENQDWNPNTQDVLFFQRFMVHGDWRIQEKLRVFGQLKTGLVTGREGNPSGLDQDQLDIHQLYIEWQLGKSRFQLGRKELWYGSRRLLSIREGTNVRQSFDGLRWIWQKGDHRLDAFFYLYNPQRTGVLDNRINDDRRLWGVYYTGKLIPQAKANFDLYYLGVENTAAPFESGVQNETRHSYGIRHWGNYGPFSYNNEFVYQTGSFGESNIQAWTVSTHLDLALGNKPESPSLGLKTEIVSGDRNANDNRLQTFNPLYPRGGYFGLLALIGPANLIDLHPSFSLPFAKKWELNLDWDIFWRHRLGDGIYFPSGRLNVASGGSRQRFIGHQLGGEIVYSVNRFLELEASCFYFITGAFLEDITAGANILQVGTSVNFRF